MKKRSACPVSHVLDLVGDRWSLLVVRDLAFRGSNRFSQLSQSAEKIATNILTERLKRLEQVGIVNKLPDPQDGRRYIYELTEAGKDLLPLLVEMYVWSAHHDPDTKANRSLLHAAETDREGLLQTLRRNIENQTFTLRAIEDDTP